MTLRSLLMLSLPFVATLALGCGDDEAGPIDGSWKVTSLTCDGATQPIGDFTLEVHGGSGTFVQKFGPDCVATLEESYAYPDAKTFSIKADTIACAPKSGCPAVFGGADCPPLPPLTEFAYARSGGTLTFSRAASLPSDPCPTGQQVVFVMQQQ